MGGANKTAIVVKSNLNFGIIKEYLNDLTNCDFLAVDETGRFYTTPKGMKFVEDYLNLVKPINGKSTDSIHMENGNNTQSRLEPPIA